MACDAIALANYRDDRSIYAETLFALPVSKTEVPAIGSATAAKKIAWTFDSSYVILSSSPILLATMTMRVLGLDPLNFLTAAPRIQRKC